MKNEYVGKGLFIKTVLGLWVVGLALLYGLARYLFRKKTGK